MMDVTKERISYKEISEGFFPERDDYNLASYLTDTRKRTFFANPNIRDENQCLLNLVRLDDAIVGRSMLYETRMVIDSTVYPCQCGSTLDVPEQFRQYAIGADLFHYFTMETKFDYAIASGISEIALPLYKAMKYHIIEFPRMMLLLNSRSLIESKGISGCPLKFMTAICNVPLRILSVVNNIKSKRLRKKFSLKRENRIPEWVDDLTIRDKHKYKEAHGREWLQWNLDYNFKGDKEDIQSFYTIEKEEKPVGFFMTKERFRKDAGGILKNIILAAIVEWGTYDEKILNEKQIINLAFSTFSKNVDIIEFASVDKATCKAMKNMGYINHGNAHIAFKDKTKKCKDASDASLWRVRYGYADVILT